ncbi:ABC transporter ATP-binding protein [Pseudomonas sp. K5002]|uniref:ABC transporter ATP-binding protein n=1 Tax=Pseudomonas sp. K5002 TaxID=2738828 RepID=UPI0015B9FFAD|nr:ATP-binding cassette domain-containing protein [Pseudomonas sp. K5002]NWD86750.1 ATP-binding cassette domain-containing protein [Pseudomonas sp. K5002]
MALLQLERISAQYPGSPEPVLADISLSLGPQQLLVALGPSGSGKTSLLNLIAGFVEPSAGRITLDGVPVKGPSAERGVVFQDDALLPWQDVLANVGFGLELAGVPKDQREIRAREMLALVDLAGFDSRRIWQLSGGQKQRVGLARALAADPRVLLMDEPFGALDAQMRLTLQTELLRLCRKLNKTVLFVTHDVDEAIALADRCVVFAGRPGTIDHVLDIPLGGERNLVQLRSDPRYVELCAALWKRLAPDVAGAADPASLAHSLEVV